MCSGCHGGRVSFRTDVEFRFPWRPFQKANEAVEQVTSSAARDLRQSTELYLSISFSHSYSTYFRTETTYLSTAQIKRDATESH